MKTFDDEVREITESNLSDDEKAIRIIKLISSRDDDKKEVEKFVREAVFGDEYKFINVSKDDQKHTGILALIVDKAMDVWWYDRYKTGQRKFEWEFGQLVDLDGNTGDFSFVDFLAGKCMFLVNERMPCSKCGEYNIMTTVVVDPTEKVIKFGTRQASGKPCYQTHDYQVSVEFKAGETVYFGDWLGGCSRNTGASLNSDKGLEDESRFYEQFGILKVQVGNSCPTVYHDIKENRIYIGCPAGMTHLNEDEERVVKPEYAEQLVELGYICTDMWATCIASSAAIDRCIAYDEKDTRSEKQLYRATIEMVMEEDTRFDMTVFNGNPYDDWQRCHAVIDLVKI